MNIISQAITLVIEGAYTNRVRIFSGSDRLTDISMRDRILSGQLKQIKQVNEETCIHCGMCSRACPTQAIEMIVPESQKDEEKPKKIPEIDSNKCIYCFQCHDICPVFKGQKKAAAIHPRGITLQGYQIGGKP